MRVCAIRLLFASSARQWPPLASPALPHWTLPRILLTGKQPTMLPSVVECPQCCTLAAKALSIKNVYDPDEPGRVVAVVAVYFRECGYVFTEVDHKEVESGVEAGNRQ